MSGFCSVTDVLLRNLIFLQGLINLRPQEFKLPVSLLSSAVCVCVIAMTRGLHILVLILRQMGNEENLGATCAEKALSARHTSETERHEMERKCLKPPDLTEDSGTGHNLFFFSSLNWISIFGWVKVVRSIAPFNLDVISPSECHNSLQR